MILFCERNKDKSSTWNIYVTCDVTCDDVRVVGMFMLRVMTLSDVLELNWCCAICISRGGY